MISRFLKWRLVFIILLFLAMHPAKAEAQFNSDSGNKPFNIDNIKIPSYFLEKNSFYHYYENKTKDRLLMLHNYLTSRMKKIQWDAPLAIYRTKDFDLVLGNQLLGDIQPYYSDIPYQGARVAKYFKNGAILAYGGNSGQADNYVNPSQQNLRDYQLAGLVGRWRLARNTSVQGAVNFYKVSDIDARNNANVLISLATSPNYGTDFDITYGIDNKPKRPGLTGRNDALSWNFSYSRNRLDFRSTYNRVGPYFGPEVSFSFNQGQTVQNHQLTYKISPRLQTDFSYREMKYEPAANSFYAFRNRYLYNHYRWDVNNRTKIQAGVDQFIYNDLTGSAQGRDRTRTGYFAKVQHKMGKADLNYEYRRNRDKLEGDSASSSDTSHLVGINYNFTPKHLLGISYNIYQNFDVNSISSTTTKALGLRYRYELPDNRGYLNLNMNRTQFFDPFLQAPAFTTTRSVNAEYWFSQLIGLSAGYYNSDYPGRTSSYESFSASLIYLLSKNTELRLSYFSNPIETIYYVQDRPTALKNIVSLQMRQSYGGPLEKSFTNRWSGNLACRVLYKPKGQRAELGPLSSDMPAVNFFLESEDMGRYEAKTDKDGVATFSKLDPGRYKLSVDTKNLDSHLVPITDTSINMDIPPGTRKSINFNVEANSSLYAVVWNDHEGTGKIGIPYTGFSNVKVHLGDGVGRLTNDDGVAIFDSLSPGRVNVQVDPSTFPKGVVNNGPMEKELELKPGLESVATFSLQGWGFVKGVVYEVPKNKPVEVRVPVSNVSIRAMNKTVTKSGDGGGYRVRLPAGSHRVSLDLPSFNSRAYNVTKEEYQIQLKPEEEISLDFTLAYTGKITGRLMELKDNKLTPFRQGGIVINFTGNPSYVYTDNEGAFQFDNLRIGRYKSVFDRGYIPQGYQLVSPAELETEILSGSEKQVEFVLKKK